MRIALVALHFTEIAIELADAFSVKHDVLLIIDEAEKMRVFGKGEYFQISKKVCIRSIQHRTFRNPKVILNIYSLMKWIKDFDPDIIHIQETPRIYLSIATYFWKKYPIILTTHDPVIHLGEHKKKHHILARDVLRKRADSIIVHGEYLRKIMENIVKKKKIFIVPLGCYFIIRSTQYKQTEEEENTVLFFGRINKYKGIGNLIKAEPYIKKEIPDIKIIIAGTGPDLDNYRIEIENNESYILYDWYIPTEMVAELFQKASVVVLPYIEATQSGVLTIAYAFGKPVVSTEVGSIPEVVENYKTGILVPPKNTEKLAKAIIYLLKNPNERIKMGIKALEKANLDLSWRNIAQKTIRVYQDTLNRK